VNQKGLVLRHIKTVMFVRTNLPQLYPVIFMPDALSRGDRTLEDALHVLLFLDSYSDSIRFTLQYQLEERLR
jgi:hypothetical protein